MESLTPDILALLNLSPRTEASLARCSKKLHLAVSQMWCQTGISLRQAVAFTVLAQGNGQRWKNLEKLWLWSLWYPEETQFSWDTFPIPFPHLRELTIQRLTPPRLPWSTVLELMPVLQTFKITSRLCLNPTHLLKLVEAVQAAAPKVRTLHVHCEGLVIYIKTQDDPITRAIKALYDGPVISSTTLISYSNTGQQAAPLKIDAPLRHVMLEEGDDGPCGFRALGPRCDTTLETLEIKALETRLPSHIRERFVNVKRTHVTVTLRSSGQNPVCRWLAQEIPVKTSHLRIEINLSHLPFDKVTEWSSGCLSLLSQLRQVHIVCSHLALGTSGLIETFANAAPCLTTCSFSTRRRAVEALQDMAGCTDWDDDEEMTIERDALVQEEGLARTAANKLRLLRPNLDFTLRLATCS